MPTPRATRLQEAYSGPRRGERVIDARYKIVSRGRARSRGNWRSKLMAALVTIACVALAGLALPPLVMAAIILNDALTR